jgi:hypothetical protein
MAYLRVETPRFLFLEGSAGAEDTADAATVAPPDASAACVSTSTARRHLCSVRRLLHRLPGGGRSRARPRHLFLRHLRGSR